MAGIVCMGKVGGIENQQKSAHPVVYIAAHGNLLKGFFLMLQLQSLALASPEFERETITFRQGVDMVGEIIPVNELHIVLPLHNRNIGLEQFILLGYLNTGGLTCG